MRPKLSGEYLLQEGVEEAEFAAELFGIDISTDGDLKIYPQQMRNCLRNQVGMVLIEEAYARKAALQSWPRFFA